MSDPRRSSHSAALALTLLGFGLSASAGIAVAQPTGEPPRRLLTPAQEQKIFPEHKALAIRDRQARIAILQRGERCVSAATSAEALRACLRQEREAYQVQRSQHRAEMRRLLERNGISLPERPRRGRWDDKGGPGGPGGPGGLGGDV